MVIGGLKLKVLGASASLLEKVVAPRANEQDLIDAVANLELNVSYVSSLKEAVIMA